MVEDGFPKPHAKEGGYGASRGSSMLQLELGAKRATEGAGEEPSRAENRPRKKESETKENCLRGVTAVFISTQVDSCALNVCHMLRHAMLNRVTATLSNAFT